MAYKVKMPYNPPIGIYSITPYILLGSRRLKNDKRF